MFRKAICIFLFCIAVCLIKTTCLAAPVLLDDFTNGIGSQWNAIPGLSRFVSKTIDGNNAVFIPEKDDTSILLTKDTWSDCTVETRYMVLNQKGTGGLQLRSDAAGKNAYILRFIVKPTESTLNLSRLVNDSAISLKTFSFSDNSVGLDDAVVLNKWYDLKVKLAGNHIQVYVDNILVLDVQDPAGSFPSGAMGIRTYSASAAFDDFHILPQIAPIVPHYATKTGIALNWSPVDGADQYRVTRITSSVQTELYCGSDLRYFDTGLTPGVSYQYTLTALFDSGAQPPVQVESVPVSFTTLSEDFPGGSVPPGYVLEFEDDFNGTALDESNWFYRVDESADSAQVKEAVTVKDGNAVIHCGPRKTGTKNYQGGGIVTQKAFSYGYYEARVKYAVPNGWHPSFWTSISDGRQPQADLKNVERLEIDINEFEMGMWNGQFQTNVAKWWDWPGKAEWKQVYVQTPDDVQTQYHVWGAEFTPEFVKFYLDGQLLVTTDISSYPPSSQHVNLSCIGFLRDFGHLEEGEVLIDYFRFYKNSNQPYTHEISLSPHCRMDGGILSGYVLLSANDSSKISGKTITLQVSDSRNWLTPSPVTVPVTVPPQEINGQFVFIQPFTVDCIGTAETTLRVCAELDHRAQTRYLTPSISPFPEYAVTDPLILQDGKIVPTLQGGGTFTFHFLLFNHTQQPQPVTAVTCLYRNGRLLQILRMEEFSLDAESGKLLETSEELPPGCVAKVLLLKGPLTGLSPLCAPIVFQ